jgi:hypothetical protein
MFHFTLPELLVCSLRMYPLVRDIAAAALLFIVRILEFKINAPEVSVKELLMIASC